MHETRGTQEILQRNGWKDKRENQRRTQFKVFIEYYYCLNDFELFLIIDSKTPSSIPGNKSCGQSSQTNDDFKRETSDPGIRKPNTKPFNRLQGIGRGIVPISGRMSANRQIGVSREDDDSNSNPFSIKREREDTYQGVKRFSPDLPKNF